MRPKHPTSLFIFITSLFITLGVFTAAVLFHKFNWDTRNLKYLAATQLLVALITPVGIYSAIKHHPLEIKSRVGNRVGLWGNTALLCYTIGLMVLGIVQ